MVWMRQFCGGLLCGLAALISPAIAWAQALSLDVEAVRVTGVGAAWETVDLLNTYTSPVVACVYVLPSVIDPATVVRVRSAGATSFEVRVQQFGTGSAVTASDVHCLIVDAGVHTLPGGLRLEAETVLSRGTAGNALGWTAANSEDLSGTRGHAYASMVVLGQVMTFNDANPSAFWTFDCVDRRTPPTPAAFCVGKHIGEINATRADETLGVITIEAGTGVENDVAYAFARGLDTVRGVGNGPPFSYAVTGDFDTGVATQAAMDGANGGWAVLFGADPLPNTQVQLSIDEETVNDVERSHTTEQVDYGVFRDDQTASVTASKSVAVSPESTSPYAIPGSDVIYTLAVANSGTAPLDEDTIFLADTLPPDTVFFNGDIDGAGPETGSVAFDPKSSGLTFTPATDLGFSTAATRPADFSACGYMPSAGYDAAVRHVCFAPKGRMRAGSIQPDEDFTLSFRAQIE